MHYLMAAGSLALAALLAILESRDTRTDAPWMSVWRIGLIVGLNGLAFVTLVRA